MAWSKIQSKNVNGDAPSVAASFTGLPTVGNLIIVAVSNFNAAIGNTAIADNQGNTYAAAAVEQANATSGDHVRIFYALANTSAGTFTITATVGTPTCTGCTTVAIHEFSGNATSSPLDTGTGATGNSSTPSSGNITPGGNGYLIFAAEVDANVDATTITAGTDFTIAEKQLTSSTKERIGTEWYSQPTAAAHAGTFTLGASQQWACTVASFKPFVASTSNQVTRMMMGMGM